jgi:C4-dicarboxylate transporter DctM subunit
MDLSSEAVAVIGFIVLFALMLLRVPVGMAMGLVGVSGFGYISGRRAGAEDGQPDIDAYRYRLYIRLIPMFLLMGSVASRTGTSRELFRVANRFVGHWRGGLGIARSRLALDLPRSAGPRWRRRRRSRPLLIRRCAVSVIGSRCDRSYRRGRNVGGDVSALDLLAVYGLITQQDIGKLFIAGIPAGVARGQHVYGDHCCNWCGAAWVVPAARVASWREPIRR